jgi:hypothetical protein
VRRWALLALALLAAPAAAQDAGGDGLRDYCPERPGLDTPPCIIDAGHVSIEASLADWTVEKDGHDRTDTILFADALARIGLTKTVEAQIGWTPLGHQYQRGGGTADRVGDVTLGVKASLAHPDGDGFSVAALPFVTLPVGRAPIGAGDWGAGFLLPISYDLSKAVQLEATPEVDAAVNGDGHGRHLAYSGTAGLGWKLTDAVTLTGEGQLARDDDPAGGATSAIAALSVAWQPGKNWQLDLFGGKGLNHAAPDFELYGGVSVRL